MPKDPETAMNLPSVAGLICGVREMTMIDCWVVLLARRFCVQEYISAAS
jgi:hypothetical protein